MLDFLLIALKYEEETKMVNFFDLTFGKLSNIFLSIDNLISKICYDFSSEVSSSNLHVISGVRGSVKTVLLNKVHSMMSEETDGVTVKVNPDRDILGNERESSVIQLPR